MSKKSLIFTVISGIVVILVISFIVIIPVIQNKQSLTSSSSSLVIDNSKSSQNRISSSENKDMNSTISTAQLYQYFTTNSQNGESPLAEKSGASGERTTFALINGELSPAISDIEQAKIWTYFKAIASPQFVDLYLKQISFYNNPDDNSQASVVLNDDGKLWSLEVNMGGLSNLAQRLETLVHEYYHIVSLNITQVIATDSCSTLKLSEGCTLPESPVYGFYKQFWESFGADPSSDKFGQYYKDRENQFVTEYAGTNVIEDFAETITYYTLRGTMSPSTAGQIAQDKLNFVAKSSFAATAQGTQTRLGALLSETGVLK